MNLSATAHSTSVITAILTVFAVSFGGKANAQYIKQSGPSDLVLSVQMELKGAKGTFQASGTNWVKAGGSLRADFDSPQGSTSVIRTPDSEGLIALDHKKKIWRREQPPPGPPLATIPDEIRTKLRASFPMRFTGRTQEIAGWNCKEFIAVDNSPLLGEGAPHSRTVYWIATDFPDGASLQKKLESLNIDPQRVKDIRKQLGISTSLPGFALRTETQEQEMTNITTFTAIKQEELPDSLFEIPSDYLQSLAK